MPVSQDIIVITRLCHQTL